MAMASSLTLSLLLVTLIFTPTTSQSAPSISTTSPLDPDQITALRSLNLPTKPDPCSSSDNNAAAVVKCDSSSPFRHVTSLFLSNLTLSLSPLKSLRHSLSSLSLSLCHVTPRRRPLTGVFLATFSNLTHLSVTTSPINASGPTVILHGMKNLQTVRISDSNLTGVLPKKWRSVNLTAVDFSRNRLRGRIPSSISSLEGLESLDFSGNGLDGEIPSSVGDLVSLKNLSLSSNSISGSLPKDLPVGLERLDLGSNQLNGTIPHFISSMKSLKYLNLEKNNFEGVMPFNASFIKKLEVFKIGGNSNLCYNHSKFSTKVKLGIAPCDKHGLPLSPPPPKDDGGDDSGDDYSPDDGSPKKKSSSHGPNKVVLGVAIGLSAVVFLIIFCVLISKCCR